MKRGERGFFAFADFYGGGGQALISVLYLVFLTDFIKLNPILAGIVVMISEIWDAISDPLMGIIGDRTETRMGRRRPYILAGGCLLAVAFGLIFLPIGGDSQALKFIYCAATYLFYNTISTMINVSYSSMSAEISPLREERDSANVLRLVVSTASAAVCTLLPSIVIDAYNSGKIDITTFYLIVGIGFGILFAIPVILCAIFVEERVSPTVIRDDRSGKSVEPITVKTIRYMKEGVEPLGNRPFRNLVGMYLGQALCMDVFSAGVVYFAKHVTTPKGSSTVFLGIFIAVQLLAFPIINKLIKNVNVNKIYGFGLPLSVVALVCLAVFGSNLYAAYASVFFVAVGFAGAQLTSWIMFPHTVDAGELLTGKRQSGGCSAIMTFARKSSSALVIFVFSFVLELTGYNADLAVQPDSAKLGIKYVMAFSCIIFMVFGFIMAKRYNLSKEKNVQIEKYLAAQRDGRIEELTADEAAELETLKASLR